MYKEFFSRLIFLFAPLVFWSGCKDDETPAIREWREYYPIKPGSYITYQVDSVTYRYIEGGLPQRDTVRYQLKEMVSDTFYDNQNDLNYRLEIFKRYSPNEPWAIWKVWSIKEKGNQIQKDEDELRFIKMVFPLKNGVKWKGNLYIPDTGPYRLFRNWEYTYNNAHQPHTVGSFTFDSTVTVLQVDKEIAIEKTYRKEIYAKDVGPVEIHWEHLTTQAVPPNYVNGKLNGFRIRMQVIDYQ
ncbi:MAG: hypothetical protein NZM35_01380 [Chitinophagales bacterium]|nr:hypothetical protein [Chitinophagales bacterium]MDW8419364.1 hypothetical protein [Chitinophagales bacterium]